ncbi:hypothetical protein DMUE_4439 [Dictyocoela muelleri]|nr:hypothetical protein DMUE_4439 [Dictyocoela muelleri]
MKNIEIITSNKRTNKKMIYSNYIYNYDKQHANGISWRCIRRGCSGRVTSNLNMDSIIKEKEHYHEFETKRITRIKINKTINGTKNEEFHDSIGNIYEKLNNDEKKEIPNIRNIQIYNTRKNNNKNELKNENDIEILEIYKNTFNNDLFLQYDNKSSTNRIIIFYTEELFKILKASNIICVDATFFTAPKNFSQLLILHGKYFKKTIPCVYVFMTNKTEESYFQVFEFLKSNGLHDPKNINMDFELAIYNSLHKCFPSSLLRGCLFHLSQIIVRYLKPNIINRYKYDIEFKNYVKYMYFLAFVPVNKINTEFQKLLGLRKNETEYHEFTCWFEKNFIRNYKNIANKKQDFWSVNNRILCDLPYTTNTCEAYHRYLNSKINQKNRPIGLIIEILKKEERRIRINNELLKSGKINIKDKDNRLKTVVENFEFYENMDFYDILNNILNIYIN